MRNATIGQIRTAVDVCTARRRAILDGGLPATSHLAWGLHLENEASPGRRKERSQVYVEGAGFSALSS